MSARHPGRDPRARPFLLYLLAWNSAVGLSASFFSYHMLHNLATGFAIRGTPRSRRGDEWRAPAALSPVFVNDGHETVCRSTLY